MSSIPSTSCQHPADVPARFICENGLVQWAYWCPDCETRTTQWVSKRSLTLSQVEGAAAVDLVARRAADDLRRDIARAALSSAVKPEYSNEYREYLQGPEWRERRNLVMARAGSRCEGCRKWAANDVHHLTYDHIMHEFLFELVALCRDCHERWHGKGRYDPSLATWERSG